jgi:uncharacterized protein (TIGR00251 family)
MPKSGAKLAVHVSPGAKRNQLVGWREGALWLKIAAPAVENKANAELLAFLAELLKIPKSALSILNGQASRYKTIAVEGLTETAIKDRLKTTLF